MIRVEITCGKAMSDQEIEIVERKGAGHPDQICDSVMEAICVALCREYSREFGTILHHNIDKGLLAAGKVEKRFGSGTVIRPMELTIGDRASSGRFGRELAVKEIATETARSWFRDNLRFVDPLRHLRCHVVLSPGSEELADIFERPGEIKVANDTSAAVGYYPLTATERTVMELERFLNGSFFKQKHPETGEDVKVMGMRRGRDLELTVAMPFLAPFIASEADYFVRKEEVLHELNSHIAELSLFDTTSICFNALDVEGRGLGGVYLSLLGTSAEDADSGQVGRGNRVNGLISMNRPMGTEAAAGKNPVSHVGKIYNILAHRMAQQCYQEVNGIRELYVFLLSRIGVRIDHPQLVAARIVPEQGHDTDELSRRVQQVIQRELSGIAEFCAALARGEYAVC